MSALKYHFIPAALFSKNHGGLGLYIRYRKQTSPHSRCTVRSHSSKHCLVETPDRDLLFVSDAHRYVNHLVMRENWDEYLSLNLFDGGISRDYNINTIMVNYPQNLGMGSPCNRRAPRAEGSPYILADSGGYQLYRNRFEYLSPKELALWANENADLSMVLDYPTNSNLPGIFKELATLQATNTEIMMQHKRPDLQLVNIVQGRDTAERRMFASIIERPDINRMAFGGIYTKTVLQSINTLLVDCSMLKQDYVQSHILGVANVLQVIPLMRISALGIIKGLTSDSSTHLQEAINKGYFMPGLDIDFKYASIQRRDYTGSACRQLPCSCPICSKVRWADVFALSDAMPVVFSLMMHNLFASYQYMEANRDLVSQSSTKDLKTLLRSRLKSRRGAEETVQCMDFLDSVAKHGLPDAQRKFHYYLNPGLVSRSQQQTFNTEVVEGETSVDESNRVTLAYIKLATANAISFDGKIKKVQSSQKGHTHTISGGAKGPGMKKPSIKKRVKPK